MKTPLAFLSAIAAFLMVSCGPSGQLAVPEQNIASRFELSGNYRPMWQWTEAGSPAILSLEEQGSHELLWSVREKPRGLRRRASKSSLLESPPFPAQGPKGVQEVRFSPSGKTILIHEQTLAGDKFQTVVFYQSDRNGSWYSRSLDLGKSPETKLRKLDDKTRVPVILSPGVAPEILRLDDSLLIYRVDGKTRSIDL